MKIQLKRSNVLENGSAKEPSVAQMEYGELAVNYNTADPSLFIKDSADQIVKLKITEGAQVLISDTIPSTTENEPGTLWWNSNEDSGQLFILYEDPSGGGGGDVGGPKWIEASPSTGGSGSGGAEVLVSETAPLTDDLEEGSLWWNSSSTELQLYVLYNDNGTLKWVEASPTVGDGGADGDFVNVTGDNMTGPLTLGDGVNDKITLDASDGSAKFAGNVDIINAFDLNANQVSTRLAEVGGIYTQTTKGNTSGVAIGVLESTDNGTAAEYKAFINYDGSATFDYLVKVGNRNYAAPTGAGGAQIVSRREKDNNNADVEYAEFAVQMDGTADAQFAKDNLAIDVQYGTNRVAEVAYDGSATFAGNIDCGNFNPSNGSSAGARVVANGAYYVQRANTDGDSFVFRGYTGTAPRFEVIASGDLKIGTNITNTSGTKINLNSDGSAKFAGRIDCGDFDLTSNTTTGARINTNGAYYAQRPNTDGSAFVFRGHKGTAPTFEVVASGSLKIGSNINNASSTKITLNDDGSADFAGNITAGNVTFNTGADDPANYTTTMVDGEEQQVYNGPTLDVKERLQNLISRLDSLESDEIADDATSTLLLTTVNNINAQMTKVNAALTAIRAAANVAGTLDQLKTDIAAATADI